jgi:uncharacterized protein (DUF1778 family)
LTQTGNLPYRFNNASLSLSKAMPSNAATVRLEVHISAELHSTLRRAAEIQGSTMTDFVVSAVQDAARRAIEQATIIRLTVADQETFVRALLAPSKPSAALTRAFARRRKLLPRGVNKPPLRLALLDFAGERAVAVEVTLDRRHRVSSRHAN